MEILKLRKSVKINGEEIKEIEYDLDSLTGSDVQQALKELSKKGIIVSATELDPNYHAAIFAISAGLSFDDLSLLGAKDYNTVTSMVRDFFLVDSEE